MRNFIDKDFLLSNKTAQKLFHEAAAEEPGIELRVEVNDMRNWCPGALMRRRPLGRKF